MVVVLLVRVVEESEEVDGSMDRDATRVEA